MRKVIFFIFIFSLTLFSQDAINYKQEQMKISDIDTLKEKPNISLQTDSNTTKIKLIKNESPCFKIHTVELVNGNEFKTVLKDTLKELNFNSGDCLGSQSIGTIYSSFSNSIIKNGYVTTSINMPPQNLKDGILLFGINIGKINSISINDTNSTKNKLTLADAFGNYKDDILNIRDIENALEILSTSGASSTELVPSSKQNYTDIKINKQDFFPIRGSVGIDNLGNEATGKYQGSLSVQTTNILGLNEMFYGGMSGDIFKTNSKSLNDDTQKGNSLNYYYGLTLPYERFTFDFFENKYKYDEAVLGSYKVYKYSGESLSRNFTTSYMYHRNSFSKNSIYLRLWERSNKNYIEDYELDNQRRKTAGYILGLKGGFMLNINSLNYDISYKKGTGARGALRAPEEDYNEGTSRPDIFEGSLNFRANSSIKPLTYDLYIYYMYSSDKLTTQDKLNIGDYHTVRGFDGQMSLLGNRGFYVRNTLEYNYYKTNNIYLAFDTAKVGGSEARYTNDRVLTGTGLGTKGTLKSFSYDLFAGRPLNKPENFKTDSVVLNFKLSYNF